jgi:hypothetical protein
MAWHTVTPLTDACGNEQKSCFFTFCTFKFWTILFSSLLVVQNHWYFRLALIKDLTEEEGGCLDHRPSYGKDQPLPTANQPDTTWHTAQWTLVLRRKTSLVLCVFCEKQRNEDKIQMFKMQSADLSFRVYHTNYISKDWPTLRWEKWKTKHRYCYYTIILLIIELMR